MITATHNQHSLLFSALCSCAQLVDGVPCWGLSSSQMKRSCIDETQETLRTSQFPTTHIKEKWDNDLYLLGISFGKTVS